MASLAVNLAFLSPSLPFAPPLSLCLSLLRTLQVDLQVLEFAYFGKNWIVEQKLSPDALVQIAFQVAYFLVYRACVSTYETIMTKKFFHGRTEAGFIVTHESKRLCQSFNAASSVHVLDELLKAALDAHVRVVRLASQGRGIRSLFAMKCLAQQQQQQQQQRQPEHSEGRHASGAVVHVREHAVEESVLMVMMCGVSAWHRRLCCAPCPCCMLLCICHDAPARVCLVSVTCLSPFLPVSPTSRLALLLSLCRCPTCRKSCSCAVAPEAAASWQQRRRRVLPPHRYTGGTRKAVW